MGKNNSKKLIKMVFRSYAVYAFGNEKLRTDVQKAASDYCRALASYNFLFRGYKDCCRTTTEMAIADCEVVRCRYQANSRHGEKAGKTCYCVYVNDDFVKELDFKPREMALINAVAPGLDWKEIED